METTNGFTKFCLSVDDSLREEHREGLHVALEEATVSTKLKFPCRLWTRETEKTVPHT